MSYYRFLRKEEKDVFLINLFWFTRMLCYWNSRDGLWWLFLGICSLLAYLWWLRCLTRISEKRILEISQSTTDLWKTYFRAKNPVGLKISKMATNGVTKPIIAIAWFLFFTRVSQKGEKSRRFEKIACEPSLGAGTERQSQRTKIPVRGLKLRRPHWGRVCGAAASAYQNPRKGTETSLKTSCWFSAKNVRVPKSP